MLQLLCKIDKKLNLSLKGQIITSAIYLTMITCLLFSILRLGANLINPLSHIIAIILTVLSYLPIVFTIFIIGRWVGRYPIILENHKKREKERIEIEKGKKLQAPLWNKILKEFEAEEMKKQKAT